MKTVYLTKRWQHHTPSGGYDVLAAKDSDAVCVQRYPVHSPVAKLARRAWYAFASDNDVLDYSFGDLLAEYRVLLECARRRVDVVHALYGDEQLDALLRHRRWLRARLVATFHLPAELATARCQTAPPGFAERLDAAVVVARSQLDGYRRWLGADRVFFIPHGIDTERFCPPAVSPPPTEELRLLCVGEHMRDWDAIHRVADFCRAEKLPVRIDAVLTSFEATWRFTGCDGVFAHLSVPEAELVDLYRRADALLLPVTGSTANNAVLESLACGTPVISTHTGGIPDYVDDASGWLFAPGDWPGIAALVAAMARERSLAAGKRAGARDKALTFDWQTVVAQIKEVHARAVGDALTGSLQPA